MNLFIIVLNFYLVDVLIAKEKFPKMSSSIRSPFARTVYAKMEKDNELRNMDLQKLYGINESLLNDIAKSKFILLSPDEDTLKFIENCFTLSENMILQIFHDLAKSFLNFFMEQTCINGLLGRGRMFVWSHSQAIKVLSQALYEQKTTSSNSLKHESCNQEIATGTVIQEKSKSCSHVSTIDGDSIHVPWSGKNILDVGAGDGSVTEIIAKGAVSVSVTEISGSMMRALKGKGFRVLDAQEWPQNDDHIYDIITCFNLLDRHPNPNQVMADISSKLTDDGLLVIALVLPYSPFVEYNSDSHQPMERLDLSGETLEEQVNHLVESLMPSWGFTVTSWSKVPYLCEGDMEQAFYWLSDVIVVAKKNL